MKQKYIEFDEELCCLAVRNCLKRKWRRRDFLQVVEEYAGVSRRDILKELSSGGRQLKDYVIQCIGYELFNRLNRLLEGKTNALNLLPVYFESKKDGMSGKIRNVAHCCVFHQLFNHLLVIGLYPLFKAKILPCQFASLPKRGQTGLKNFVMKRLRNNSLGIRHARKTDVKHAYESTSYSLIISIIKREIPSAMWIIALLSAIAEMSPKGCLIIGGYLDAFLFNFLMSYALRYAMAQYKIRRSIKTPLIKFVVSFMDDFAFVGSRDADIKKVIYLVSRYLAENFNLELKFGKYTGFISIAEEKRRRKELLPAKRSCPFLDVGGYRMCRGHSTIRDLIFIRLRRAFLRADKELKSTGKLCIRRAYSVISYYGYLKNTNSKKVRQKSNADYLKSVAKYTISYYSKLRRSSVLKK